jgi:hypothetical protein
MKPGNMLTVGLIRIFKVKKVFHNTIFPQAVSGKAVEH